jgi:hypothetical protein
MEADASVFYQHQNKILGGENTTKGVKILSNGELTRIGLCKSTA